VSEFREFQDGELILGTRYRVLRLIGAGGMGTVYEVEHVELGRRFVLKTLLRELARREDLVIRLRNEWRSLGRLEHPNIVNVTDAGTSAGGVPYFVMERLEGETLSERMHKTRRFSVREATAIASETLNGLHAAHQIGVVHRDVKPPNIFLLASGHVKVLDFGVAKIQNDPGVITARGIAVGTPRYMSPEQARGDAVDGRADIYAVGLLLFEMIAGVGPFDDTRDGNELILAHLARNPPRLSSLVMGVPSELDDAVSSMLAKQRGQRPHSAADAATRLQRILSSSNSSISFPNELRAEAVRALAELGLGAAPPAHDTTRPDGVASQRALPVAVATTLPAAPVAGPAGTLLGIVPSTPAAPLAAAAAPVSAPAANATQLLTVIALTEAVPSTQPAPAREPAPLPPPSVHAGTPRKAGVRPVAEGPPAVARRSTRYGVWGSALVAVCMGSIGGVLLSRMGGSEPTPNVEPSAPVRPVSEAAPVVIAPPPQTAAVAREEVSPSATAKVPTHRAATKRTQASPTERLPDAERHSEGELKRPADWSASSARNDKATDDEGVRARSN